MKVATLAASATLVVLGAMPVYAQTQFFVATTGTDTTACGTSAAPCKTIQYAIDLTEDGDTVVVEDGTYAECVVVIPGTGTGGIILIADSLVTGNVSGRAILDGEGVCDAASATPGPVVTVTDLSTLSGFGVKNGGASGIVGRGAVIITNNVVSANQTVSSGGGIHLVTGSFLTDAEKEALIAFNTVEDNTADGDGGGLYVDASAVGVESVVVINGNDVRQNSAGARGGGIFVATDTASDTDSSLVTVTTNIVEENEAGGALSLGGGLYAATGAINGLGEETIVIGIADARNALRNNVSGGWGGGLSVALAPGNGAAHTLTVASNDVTTNTAAFGGGGIHATSVAEDLATGTNALRILGNDLIGNHALGDPADPMTAGGGGIYLDAASHRTPDDVVALEIARNELRGNDATAFGGGATLSVVADDDPFLDGATQPATASLRFENNLIVANVTADGGAGTAFGGGVALFARAVGADATVAVAQRFLSVIDNESDAGAGGLDWSAAAQADSLGGIGTVAIELSNSILMGNDGFAVGGSIVPGGTISATIAYNDAIDNVGGDYAPALGASTGTNGNVAIDPGLDALYVPQLCAPIIDLGDPALDASTEPLPNGGRVNIGHHGNSIDAARTLPDVNADALVDGVDVLAVAVSFNAASPDPRYLAEADLDLNGIVDGDDLAYVSAFFAQSCPEAVP